MANNFENVISDLFGAYENLMDDKRFDKYLDTSESRDEIASKLLGIIREVNELNRYIIDCAVVELEEEQKLQEQSN